MTKAKVLILFVGLAIGSFIYYAARDVRHHQISRANLVKKIGAEMANAKRGTLFVMYSGVAQALEAPHPDGSMVVRDLITDEEVLVKVESFAIGVVKVINKDCMY